MEILDEEYNEYIEHHGIKGQKWGDQNGPPYPLDKNAARQARKAAKAEKKARRKSEREARRKRMTRYDDLTEKQKKYVDKHNRLGMSWGIYDPKHIDESIERERKENRQKALEKARKTKQKNKEEAIKKAKEEEQKKKDREKILKDPKKLYKHRHEFQKEEIQDALQRFEWEEKIHNYSTNRLANTAKSAENIVKVLDSGLRGYNKVASAYNAFVSDDAQLPIIDIGQKKKKQNSGSGSSGSGSGSS